MSQPEWATADLADDHPGGVQVVHAPLIDFGGARRFAGPIATLAVHEDYRPVRRALESAGEGRVLVVDGGGSLVVALVGERSLQLALQNGWVGVVVNGAVRDTALTAGIAVGLRALAAVPRRGESGDSSEAGGEVTFGEVRFKPGDWLWADADGIVVGRPNPDELRSNS
ncbi:MAG: ribonuclease E activity regulator RraA [Gemmatimonadales bacterium]